MTDNAKIMGDLLIDIDKRREEYEQYLKDRIEELRTKILESKPNEIDLEFTLELLIGHSKVLGMYGSSSGDR